MADQTRRRGFRSSAAVSGAVQTQQNREKWLGAALYCVLGFTTAAARMTGNMAPFGAAMVAAAGPHLGGAAALIGACVGYLVTGGLNWGIRYVASCVLMYTASFVFQNLNVYRRQSFMPIVAACIATVTTALSTIAVTRQDVPVAVRLFLEVVLTGCCVYFFSDALSGREGTTELEELQRNMSLTVLAACVLMSGARVQMFGFISLGRICCVLLTMAVAFGGGMFPGCAVGTVLGLAMDTAISMAPFFTMAYALSGMISGLFRRMGRLVFLLCFVLADGLAVVCAWSAGSRIESLLELETGYDDRIGRLEESTELDGLREELVALRKEVETLHKQVDEAILPDDSTARKAKEQIDAFNAGVYNILSYHGRQRKPEVTDDDEE